ncbi:hypothetical protein [Citricoccus sp. I39-566]|uniref:hypothetical protein n=1 Tax=Citricoccus sp. I39-566 TaxID=3073268 RepID=UPI00286D29B9|nr:hypothetical protein [Citricoccus sp. I39-566]WMY77185.1 hypothetical protein RE421_09970 [Citricoccus sp. I39-566]
MQNLTAALTVAAEEAHVVNELIAPAWVFGVGAFVLLLLLLAATMSLKSVSKRHPAPATDVDVHGAAGRGGQRSGH